MDSHTQLLLRGYVVHMRWIYSSSFWRSREQTSWPATVLGDLVVQCFLPSTTSLMKIEMGVARKASNHQAFCTNVDLFQPFSCCRVYVIDHSVSIAQEALVSHFRLSMHLLYGRYVWMQNRIVCIWWQLRVKRHLKRLNVTFNESGHSYCFQVKAPMARHNSCLSNPL